ncbi:PEP/pyruvate-binding domain-containing protein [Dysgonomonas sp. 520]|uniref:PEP/pyruvate-binding domain-containing protein n=1 Tax=Dysgonomonas sp. 520 TaxID=2302931 RepID=UPI0013D28B79|nr:PEP/pyruvate-binding domain-containing protein [Dysgonomonas sp. 520]NDW09485.1 phosphoenolpyruvate synthase [Dysgonomonas sp. 520]
MTNNYIRKHRLKDTSFASLMNKRIFNVLLIATKYDIFILEDDGRVNEQIFNEYVSLNLSYPPRFTEVLNEEQALYELQNNHYELIIYMPNMDDDSFSIVNTLKGQHPDIPVVILTPFSREVVKRMSNKEMMNVDYIFTWLGNAELLVAIIKLIEDAMNAEHDTQEVGVQIILLIEDSVRFYSSALPTLYHIILEESKNFAKEALNQHEEKLRMRGRPKIMLARSYEEAEAIYNTYSDYILGVITDMSYIRGGTKEQLAGYEFTKWVKSQDKYLPVVITSSENTNKQYADELKCSFVDKNQKTFPFDLKRQIKLNFGFGDFVIIDPDTKEEITRIRNLKDMQVSIKTIPQKSLKYHMSHNHFSRFFYSRAMFPVAEVLKNIHLHESTDLEDARQTIYEAILEYRRMKNTGTVAVFQKDRFDEFSYFARIGNGSLGGKGRGLAFMGHLAKIYADTLDFEYAPVTIPKTVVVCTDIFDEFMEMNDLYKIGMSDRPNEEILSYFLHSSLPEHLAEDFIAFLEIVKNPIAIRSSSMLEDSHLQPFAGVYSTYMIPYVNDKYEMLRMLSEGIKAVYASVFYSESKAYMTATQNMIDEEKMAVVLQEVVGQRYGDHFYPTVSGVARSINFYPIGNQKPEEGVVNLALGLGKYIVDGGMSLTYSPYHPDNILQLSTLDLALRDTQRRFYALDMKNIPSNFSVNDSFNLLRLGLKDAEKDGSIRYISSTFDPYDNIINDGYYEGGRKVITFNGLLQHKLFPLSRVLRDILSIGQQEMGRAVEIEFAVNLPEPDKGMFYLLQIRPIVKSADTAKVDLSKIDPKDTVLLATDALGHGVTEDIYDIVYVKTENFDPSNNNKVAEELEKINSSLVKEDRNYVLVAPGRWGSSDPWLGVPVKWAYISNAKLLVELGLENYRIEPSQGTHFFQNLTAFGVGYFTINPYLDGGGSFDEEFLKQQTAETETEYLRHIRFDKPLIMKINGGKKLGVVMKP